MLPHLQKILLKIFGFILKCWVCGSLKTVNFDDPTYHFYFGNQNGEPGTIITFFLFREAAREPWEKGIGRIYFSVPKGALAFWKRRLEENGLSVKEQIILSEQVLLFNDTEDLPLAIMEDERSGQSEWTPSGITEKKRSQA